MRKNENEFKKKLRKKKENLFACVIDTRNCDKWHPLISPCTFFVVMYFF